MTCRRFLQAFNWASFYCAFAYVVTVAVITKPFENKQ